MSPYPVLSGVLKRLFGYFIHSVQGIEHLPGEGPFLMAANHNSHLDQFLLLSQVIPHLGRKVHVVADQSKWFETSRIRRLVARYFEAIPIDRGGDTADGIRRIMERLEAGGVVLLYPEGTRSGTGRLQRAKTGIARIALAARVPVVPVGITGTFELLPRKRRWPDLSRPRSVQIRIGRPLDFAGLRARDEDAAPGIYRRVTDQVMIAIAELIGQDYPFAQRAGGSRLDCSGEAQCWLPGRGSLS